MDVVDLVGIGMKEENDMHEGQSQGGRMSGNARALPECEVIH